ncbi:MAG: hypothetical protein ACOYYS_05920 [Chloroflexota bacterium]
MTTEPSPVPTQAEAMQNAEQSQSCLAGLIKSIIFSAIAVVVCAAAWGLVAYFTNTIYVWAAIVIGLLVSIAALSGFKRMNIGIALLMLVPCIALTLLSIAMGDFLYYTLMGIKEAQLDWLTSVREVAEVFIEYEITSEDGRASLLFGGIGALVGFFNAARGN